MSAEAMTAIPTQLELFHCPTCGQPVADLETIPLGLRLTMLRLARGLSVAELAKQVDVSRVMLIGVENGRREPSLSLARRLARVLGVTLDELAGGVL